MKIKIYFIFIIFFTFFAFGKGIRGEISFIQNPFEKTAVESAKGLSDDEVLQSMEKILFLFNPGLRNQAKLEVHQGIVLLFGIIDTMRSQEEAVNILKTITIKGVIDYSILNPEVRLDRNIRDDIIVAFLQNSSVYAPDLEIKVSRGAVTLTGFVASSWEREEAVNTAKGIIGVIAVIDHLSVDPQKEHTRMEWLDLIANMLGQDRYLFDNSLTAKIYDDRVILQGCVDTAIEKAYASQLISALGEWQVNNQLRIEREEAGYRQKGNFDLDDLVIQQSINGLMQLDERINDQKGIRIHVEDGVVTLQGMVTDVYQEKILEQGIRSVAGVLFIKNSLTAEETSRKDMDIVRDIGRIFEYAPDLSGNVIEVTCESGKVTLNGKVDIILKKDMAERIVTRVTGVKGISNKLQVIVAEAWVNPSVNDGGRYRSGLMTWNLEVGNKTFLICVNRENGTITIRGVVEDPEQKDRAEHILKLRAPGNFQIINEIEVSHNNVSPTSPPRRTIIY